MTSERTLGLDTRSFHGGYVVRELTERWTFLPVLRLRPSQFHSQILDAYPDDAALNQKEKRGEAREISKTYAVSEIERRKGTLDRIVPVTRVLLSRALQVAGADTESNGCWAWRCTLEQGFVMLL